MQVITVSHLHVAPGALGGKARDTLPLTWEERRWTRKRVTTAGGREVALALPTGSVLRAGEVILVEDDWYLEVAAAAEPLLAVSPRDAAEAIRVAFEVGNRHFTLAIDGADLLLPDDAAMEQLVTRLRVPWRRARRVFEPIGAGHRHDPGASPVDGHRHPAAAAAPGAAGE